MKYVDYIMTYLTLYVLNDNIKDECISKIKFLKYFSMKNHGNESYQNKIKNLRTCKYGTHYFMKWSGYIK